MTAARPFDLLLKGGRVVDPASGLDTVRDIGIARGHIAALGTGLNAGPKTKVVDVAGMLVTPGLIDTHAHVYEHVSGDFGLNPDLVGVRSGVTTVVDQGGPSALTFDGFRRFIVDAAKTRVLAFISAYLAGGLLGHRYVDLYGPMGINVKAIVKAARDNADLVRGIKAHAEPGGYSRWGMASLKLAKEASRELGLPVYIHLGTLWPEADGAAAVDATRIIDEVVPLLDAGDILAHPFTRFPSGFVGADGKIHPLIDEALAKGVRIDVGRGAHFSYTNARRVIDAGILPFTLGADLHGYNVRFKDGGRAYRGMFTDGADAIVAEDQASPFERPYSLHHAMTELLALGVPLIEIVRMATSNAASLVRLDDEIGAIAVGRPADLSVMRLLDGRWTLIDSERVEFPARQLLHPEFAVRAGKIHHADSPLLPEMAALAA